MPPEYEVPSTKLDQKTVQRSTDSAVGVLLVRIAQPATVVIRFDVSARGARTRGLSVAVRCRKVDVEVP